MNVVGGRGDKDMAVTSKSAAAKWFGLFDGPAQDEGSR
ncbi:hypothetical protein NRB20_43020 [Nocardia sp. RB20]|uniref:Uncharacterized protein n=1 Tax=Nocardia macrotermitis TaxID=2585198 RepID=A0A7K0D768_9NOCA|nr:hypothetical protein [Nocardia macrotermitis]